MVIKFVKIFGIMVFIFLLAGCNTFPTSTESPMADAPDQSCDNSSGEARILYILTDIQLSGDSGYYAQLADLDAAQAVSRWNDGVRVQNISEFERKIVDGSGWQIVYAGTETTICGGDVITTTERPVTFCSNRYWPIVEGAHWEYTNGFFLSVNSVDGNEIGGTASLATPTGEMTLTCLADGIHNQDFLLLPLEHEIGEADYRDFSPDYVINLTHTTERTVPAGTFLAVRVVIGSPYSGTSVYDIWYGKNVGIIEYDPSQDESEYILHELTAYTIP